MREILFILLSFLTIALSVPPWPKYEFQANIKTTSKTSEYGPSNQRVTISLIQKAYRFNRRRINKKSLNPRPSILLNHKPPWKGSSSRGFMNEFSLI